MRALVTGSHGFAGTHLRARLREAGWQVVGWGRTERAVAPGETYEAVDLALDDRLPERLDAAAPDVVFHLAARVGRGGDEEAARVIRANVDGTLHLLRALVRRGVPTRVIVAGSSAQYGCVPDHCDPVSESAPQFPLGVYGWSKVAAEGIAMAHHGVAGLEVIATRPFNHTGPGEPEHLVGAAFARQIAEIEAGAEPVLNVGDLAAVRDFTDVRDIVRGYVDLAERGTPGRVYNLCSGRGVAMEDVLRMLLDKTEATIEVRADSNRMRAAELARQVGDATRVARETGWSATIPLEDSLADLLEERRTRLRATKEMPS